MNMPTIRARIGFERVVYKGQRPKYRISKYAGSSEYLGILKSYLRGRDGNLNFYLRAINEPKPDEPEIKLEVVRNSMNFTGIYQYFTEGKPSGYGCGCPFPKEEYDGKPNPFYQYRTDGFLFRFDADMNDPTNLWPTSFELIVLTGADVNQLKTLYLSAFRIGGFAEALDELPLQSIDTL